MDDADPLERFAAFVRADEFDRLDLPVALIGATFDRRADIDAVLGELDQLGQRFEPSFEAIMDGLFGSGLLRGNADDYADPRNSYLHEVLGRRLGLPITLSIVAVEVGRRCGVRIDGIGLPGHFVVGDGSGERFADPFHGGRVYDRDGMNAAWRRITRAPTALAPAMLLPTPPRAIVVRVLNNLVATFEQRQDEAHLPIVARLRAAVPGIRDEVGARRRWLAGWN
jgi:regulator of sirC expression with transglutaminase-like and TPR domain